MVALGTDAGAAVMRPGSLFWRKAFFPAFWKDNRHIGIEVCAPLRVRMRVSVCMRGSRRLQ